MSHARIDLDIALGDWLATAAPVREVDYLEDILATTARTGQRSSLTSLDRWLPVTILDGARAVARPAWILIVLVVLLALVAGAIVVGSRPSVPKPYGLARNGLVAFDNGNRVVLVNADGSGQRMVATPNGETDTNPTWSPDGTRLAFWRAQKTDRWAIVITDAKGVIGAIVPTDAPVSRGTHFPGDASSGRSWIWFSWAHGAPSRLSWSPDSRLIAFSQPALGVSGIWTVRADGTGLRRVGDRSLPANDAVWSPDGSRLAFHGGSQVGDTNGVYVMHADGTGARKVSHVDGNQNSFDGTVWQPGGELLAFTVFQNDGAHVYVVRSDGTDEADISARVPGDFQADDWPAWSPDGSRLAFLRGSVSTETDGLTQIVVVDPDGSHPALPKTKVAWMGLQWSPDGRRLEAFLYDAVRGVNPDIVTIDVLGRSPPVTVPIPDSFGGSSWQRLAP